MNNDTSKYIPLAVIIIGLLATYGTAPTSAKTTISPYEIERAKAVVPFQAAMMQPGSNVTPEPYECQCGGTGRSGDGLGPCGCENCQCKKSGAKPTENPNQADKIYMFTGKWCGACRLFHDVWDKKLAERGWDIGWGDRKHIEFIDVDKDPDAFTKYSNPEFIEQGRPQPIPAFVAVKDGKVIRRCDFYADDWDIWWLWSGEGRDRKQSDIAPTIKRRQNNARTNQPATSTTGRQKVYRQTGRRYSRRG